MPIVAVQKDCGTPPPAESPVVDDHEARAHWLRAAIDHHRAVLAVLFDRRREHAIELHRAGWKLGPIGGLYRLTSERARQIITPSFPSADQDDGVVA